MWTKINERLKKKTKINEDIYLPDNRTTLLDTNKVVSNFNDYLINVSQNPLKNLGKTNNQFQDYLTNPCEHSLFLKETEPGEVLQILKSLNLEKSTDIFGISPKLIKRPAEVLKTHIATLLNYSINQGIFPNNLKIALIDTIHKDKSKLMCSNHCPICILSILSKIFEKLMYKELYDLKKAICNSQFGFPQGKSTEHTILDLYTKVIQSIEKQGKSSCIFLDLARAFDTVDHKIL